MICVAENVTKSTGFRRNNVQQPPPPLICLCDEENGYIEDLQDNRCNGKFVDKIAPRKVTPSISFVFYYNTFESDIRTAYPLSFVSHLCIFFPPRKPCEYRVDDKMHCSATPNKSRVPQPHKYFRCRQQCILPSSKSYETMHLPCWRFPRDFTNRLTPPKNILHANRTLIYAFYLVRRSYTPPPPPRFVYGLWLDCGWCPIFRRRRSSRNIIYLPS